MTVNTRAVSSREGLSSEPDASIEHENKESNNTPLSPSVDPTPALAPTSDRPVRHQLKKTHLDKPAAPNGANEAQEYASSESGSVETTDVDRNAVPDEPADDRSRARRKRSFDEVETDHQDASRSESVSKHVRKRSRSGDKEPALTHTASKESLGDKESPETTGGADGRAVAVAAGEARDAASGMAPQEVAEPPKSSVDDQDGTDSKSSPEEEQQHKSSTGKDSQGTPPAVMTKDSALDESFFLTSPTNKRNRAEFAEGAAEDQEPMKRISGSAGTAASNGDGSTQAQPPETSGKAVDGAKTAAAEEAENGKKDAPGSAQIPQRSGFSNTSSASPFGALSPKSTTQAPPSTSSKAFASSGFASFATSASPFGSVAPTTTPAPAPTAPSAKLDAAPSSFASMSNAKSPFLSSTPSAPKATGTFGGSLQGFGTSTASGFGNLSAGTFGSAFKPSAPSAPLTSFASGNGKGIIGLSSKPAKPFGAPAGDDDEENEGAEEGETSEPEDHAIRPIDDATPSDPRFFEQEVETGEEDEETVFSQRAKLYVITDKVWKERGVGVIKINVARDVEGAEGSDGGDTEDDEEQEEQRDAKRSARFIMRADGSHRIVLNSPITKDISISDPSGGAPKGKHAVFLGFLDGKPKLMQLKMKSSVQTAQLHSVITELQAIV